MARPEYPLEALRKLREERVDSQATRLAQQVSRVQAAQASLAEAEGARRDHDAETRAALEGERKRLSAGGASGADLLRLAEFEAASRARAGKLAHAEQALREVVMAEREVERRERAELARLEAEAKLVQAHETEFHERHLELASKAEEEAALEQWNARRH